MFAVIIAGILFYAVVVFLPFRQSVEDKAVKNQVSQNLSAEEVDKPVRLKIPSIGVNAIVEYAGLTAIGAMDVPKGPANVAWFDLGPRPGEKGNAVIAGHYGWKNGIPAVFDGLSALRKGDKIYVEDEKGVTMIFTVRESRMYGENGDGSEVFGLSDKAHLNLITCEGIWNKVERSYSGRLVVFSDLE